MTTIRVLDAADAHGAFAVEVLAALGARVERAPLSAAALARADVAVVGGAARPWCARRGEWPRLVLVAVTPFGLAGPRCGWAGGELVAQAAGGVLWPNGDPAAAPLPLPGAPVTRAAGLHAALGALLALRARARDGHGRLVDVSLQESAAALLEHVAGEWCDRGAPARRQGSLHWNGTFRVGRCRDGAVLLSHVGDWTALREWLRADGAAQDLAEPRWDDVDERCRHAAHVFAVLDAWAARYRVDDLVAQAQLRRLPFAPVWDFGRFGRDLGAIPTAAILAARPLPVGGAAPPAPVVAGSRDPRATGRDGTGPSGWGSPCTGFLGSGAIHGRPAAAADAPLHGVRVVDFTWVVAGPLATRILADFGAEVIRIERPDAPRQAGTSAANLQRGKRRLRLDLRTADGIAAVRALLRGADVVVDNFSRRVLPNLGLDDDALGALNPRLVIAHLAGFPAGDPRADWASFAPTLHALGGLTAAMPAADGAPAGPGFALADTASGWAAALAIVAALSARDGVGARIDLAQRDVLALLLAPRLAAAPGAGPAPAGVFRCADRGGSERWCAIAVADDAAWRRLGAAVAQPWAAAPRFATVAGRRANAAELDRRLRGWTRRRRAEAVAAALQARVVQAAVVATPADLLRDPQLLLRGWWRRADRVVWEGVVPRLATAPA